MPVAPRLRALRRGCRIEQRERIGGALLRQQVSHEVETRADIVRCGGKRFAQQRLRGLGLAGDAQEGAEIGYRGRVAGPADQRLPHRGLGVLDGALAIARDAVIHPGIGPGRCQAQRGREGLLRPDRLARRQPGFAVSVMGFGAIRRRMARIACRLQSRCNRVVNRHGDPPAPRGR